MNFASQKHLPKFTKLISKTETLRRICKRSIEVGTSVIGQIITSEHPPGLELDAANTTRTKKHFSFREYSPKKLSCDLEFIFEFSSELLEASIKILFQYY